MYFLTFMDFVGLCNIINLHLSILGNRRTAVKLYNMTYDNTRMV